MEGTCWSLRRRHRRITCPSWEEMAPKDHVLESVDLSGPVSVAGQSTAEVAAGAKSVAEARPLGSAKDRAVTAATAVGPARREGLWVWDVRCRSSRRECLWVWVKLGLPSSQSTLRRYPTLWKLTSGKCRRRTASAVCGWAVSQNGERAAGVHVAIFEKKLREKSERLEQVEKERNLCS